MMMTKRRRSRGSRAEGKARGVASDKSGRDTCSLVLSCSLSLSSSLAGQSRREAEGKITATSSNSLAVSLWFSDLSPSPSTVESLLLACLSKACFRTLTRKSGANIQTGVTIETRSLPPCHMGTQSERPTSPPLLLLSSSIALSSFHLFLSLTRAVALLSSGHQQQQQPELRLPRVCVCDCHIRSIRSRDREAGGGSRDEGDC